MFLLRVRQCRTALPHYQTALSDESFVADRGTGKAGSCCGCCWIRMRFFGGWSTANSCPELLTTCARNTGNDILVSTGSARGRGCPRLWRGNNGMSHKLAAHFNGSIPSSPARCGIPPPWGKERQVVWWFAGARQGSGRPFRASLWILAPSLTPGLWLFMPVYFILSY